jgi:hypothetical protein
MEIVYYFWIITIIGALIQLLLNKKERTKNRIFEVFLLWFLVNTSWCWIIIYSYWSCFHGRHGCKNNRMVCRKSISV